MAAAGIHLGNTNCVVAVSKDGKVDTISNESGDRTTPTVIAYTGDEKIIGLHAKQYLTRNPHRCITNIKASIGNSFHRETFEDVQRFCSCEVENRHGEICHNIKLDDDVISVTTAEALSYIFTKLLEVAESYGGEDLEDVALAVPLSFTDQQKMSIMEAAENIGFNVLRVISEPSAALLAHGIGQNDQTETCNVLVFRLGGSSSDACLINVNGGMYHVLGENRKSHFGANCFDDVLVNTFISEFKKKYKMDISDNKKAVNKLRSASEECKRLLTTMNTTKVTVESLYDGIDFSSNMTRIKFESITSSIISKCMEVIDELLKSLNFSKENIHKVVLVGGGSYIPKVISAFKDEFQSAELLDSKNAGEIIANGAAVQASLLQSSSQLEHTPKLKCLSKNIGIKVSNSTFEVLLAKDTSIPTSFKKAFKIPPNQNSVVIPLYESSNRSMDDAKLLAKIVMRDLQKAETKERELKLSLQINRTGNIIAILSNDRDEKESVTITCDQTTH